MGDFEITEDDIRSSRHGYYASLAYVDEKIGEVLTALERLRARRRHGRALHLGPRRVPGRARALLQDVVPRASRPRPAHRALPRALRAPARSGARLARRRAADARRPRAPRALGRACVPGGRPQPRPAARRRAREPRDDRGRRVPGGGRRAADGDASARTLEVHPYADRSRSALRPGSRPARARQPRGRGSRGSCASSAKRCGGAGTSKPSSETCARASRPASPFSERSSSARHSRGTSSRRDPRPSSTRATRWTSRRGTSSRGSRRFRSSESCGLPRVRRAARDRGAHSRRARGGRGPGPHRRLRDLPQRHRVRRGSVGRRASRGLRARGGRSRRGGGSESRERRGRRPRGREPSTLLRTLLLLRARPVASLRARAPARR